MISDTMVSNHTKTVLGTLAAGYSVSITLGINQIGLSAIVGLSTLFVATPLMLHFTRTGSIDSDSVFKMGLAFGIGLYLFGAATLLLFDSPGIVKYALPVRLAAISVFAYIAVYRI